MHGLANIMTTKKKVWIVNLQHIPTEFSGVYNCVCCGTALFSSKNKFDSGSGWPSFVDTVRDTEDNDKITRKTDFKFGMRRTEVLKDLS